MNRIDPLIHTKLRLPFTRANLVSRPRLMEHISQGLRCPLTIITAPAGFGKTTLLAASLAGCGLPVAWLSLDKGDNQTWNFLKYLFAALQEADRTIGIEASERLEAAHPEPSETILTYLVNDLDRLQHEIALVLDDYQFISTAAVHQQVTFLLEHCPSSFHLVISTRSDPPLPVARLRARGQIVELRATDLRFTESEAAQFLNEVMGLGLDAGLVAALADRTEGWIAGLQMAALSMRDKEDVIGFVEGFSGTNRYILDFLLEEVLASQLPEIQGFLLRTSILERLTAPLCDELLEYGGMRVGGSTNSQISTIDSRSILEYLERANLFLVPLDNEREWYRYHHLFADLLRNQLNKSVDAKRIALLHLRAAQWYEQNGLPLDAIHHASIASDDEMVERLIEKHYLEMVNRGEMSSVRYWMGKLSKDLVYRRPWLCLYEALNRSWFGKIEEANLLLNEAEKRIPAESSAAEQQAMLGYHSYVNSRVTAMQGDTRRAIELALTAREKIPVDRVGLQNDVSITLGYEYFLFGDFVNATKTLSGLIQSGYASGAINNPVAAYALLGRIKIYQGGLQEAQELFHKADQLIHATEGQYLGAKGLVDIGLADLLRETNKLDTALMHVKRGLDFLPYWGKADDFCLAYLTLMRIQLAFGNQEEAWTAIDCAVQLVQSGGVFSEARNEVEAAQVKMWLAQGNWLDIDRWFASAEMRFSKNDLLLYEDELARITQARVCAARMQPGEAIRILSGLEEAARSGGRYGRLIEILIQKALAFQELGESKKAEIALTESLRLGELGGYVRIFLDEGQPMRAVINQWLSHTAHNPLGDYAAELLSFFEGWSGGSTGNEKASTADGMVEPLTPRELEVLQLISLGKTNQEIARQLIISPGTVKAHTSTIYRKLDVANRTEAVARARQLGELS